MKDRILAGFLAAVSVFLIPAAVSAAWKSPDLPEQIQTVEPDMDIIVSSMPMERKEERTVSEILVHQSAETLDNGDPAGSFDASLIVTVNLGGVDQELSLQDYLCGVIMGEMPAEFPMEALKAQAVAARTYTLRRMESGGVLSDDPSVCQAYYAFDRAYEKYGDQAEEYAEKIRRAVAETDGEVMTYDGALIAATYFSCSGGKTESAQAVWGSEVPYLISVESPGEESARSYESTVTVTREALMDRLGIREAMVQQITYTEGGGIASMTIGGKTVTGVELRELFSLRSTCFTIEIDGETVTFHVLGNGHRVGLSQYGAKAMAEAGHGYAEILTWYYSGAELSEAL